MNILDKIVADKYKEVIFNKKNIPISKLENSKFMNRSCNSLANSLRNSNTGIIAEHKRKSPSRDIINFSLNVEDVVLGYQNATVCGISILTDDDYFGGSLQDLVLARTASNLPLLRKDFVIDEYQILEAKAHGADVILLIASILTKAQIKTFSKLAKSLGMDVLLEVHNEVELQKSIMPSLDMLGVNNRNLKTFEVSLETSKSLSNLIPNDFIKISESGISSIGAINELKHYGYQGFLIGENFMKTENPGKSAAAFINQLK